MNMLAQAIKYFKYRITAHTPHDIHSPFVYNLFADVIKGKENKESHKTLENLRKKMIASKNGN